MKAVQLGAQDYVPKKEITEIVVSRSIRYAIERKRVEEMSRAQDMAMAQTPSSSRYFSAI